MRTTALCLLVGAACVLCVGRAASAAPPTANPPSAFATTPQDAPVHAAKPDTAVRTVWLGQGTGDRFAPLGRDPKVGGTVSLVCKPVVRSAPPGWKIATYVDGLKTCGEGELTVPTPPVCEDAWLFAEGFDAFVDYVPHTTGTHTYMCAVDVGNAVVESSEANNSRQISFNVKGTLPVLNHRVTTAPGPRPPNPKPYIRRVPDR